MLRDRIVSGVAAVALLAVVGCGPSPEQNEVPADPAPPQGGPTADPVFQERPADGMGGAGPGPGEFGPTGVGAAAERPEQDTLRQPAPARP